MADTNQLPRAGKYERFSVWASGGAILAMGAGVTNFALETLVNSTSLVAAFDKATSWAGAISIASSVVGLAAIGVQDYRNARRQQAQGPGKPTA